MAEPAPTRRSSRTSPTPVQASPETSGVSRAELRRRAGEATGERPAIVWNRAVEVKSSTDAVAPSADARPTLPVSEPSTPTLSVAEPVTPTFSLPEAAAPVAPVPEPAPAGSVPEAPAPSTPEVAATAVAAAAASASVTPIMPEPVRATPLAAVAPTDGQASIAPLSRRARRSPQTAEQPAVVPPLEPQTVEPEAVAPAPAFASEPVRVVTPTLPDAVLTPAEPFELLEPVLQTGPIMAGVFADLTSEPVAEPVAEPVHARAADEPRATASGVDEFEAAARLFSFTGETPIQQGAETDTTAPHVAPRRRRPSNGAAFKRVTAASFSLGVMGIVGLLTVGMTTPAEAVAAAADDMPVSVLAPAETEIEVPAAAIQAYVAPATIEDVALSRAENYATVSMAQIASESGIKNFSNLFHNDPNSAIQWPFAVGVPMSYGFGMRSGRMHEGVDFTPGAGSPIQAIAEGTVRVASASGGAYGVHVIIDHEIDGQLVSSHYAHMQYGSLQVTAGQHVTVGTILGRTGNTGRSYGAHTHFEILMNGTTAIDPIPWLRSHAGG